LHGGGDQRTGQRLGSHVIETNGAALIEFFKAQAGTLHVCIEEGTQSGCLVEILSRRVERIVVTHMSAAREFRALCLRLRRAHRREIESERAGVERGLIRTRSSAGRAALFSRPL
jgi:hypothetical protein